MQVFTDVFGSPISANPLINSVLGNAESTITVTTYRGTATIPVYMDNIELSDDEKRNINCGPMGLFEFISNPIVKDVDCTNLDIANSSFLKSALPAPETKGQELLLTAYEDKIVGLSFLVQNWNLELEILKRFCPELRH